MAYTTSIFSNNTNSPNGSLTPDYVESNIFWTIFTTGMNFYQSYVIIVVILGGFIGNTLSIIIFFRQRKLDSASAGYLGPLSVFDFYNCCIGVWYWLVQGLNAASGGAIVIWYTASTTACFFAWFAVVFGMYLSGNK